MKITRVNVYQVDLPLNCTLRFCGVRAVSTRDSTIVEVITDTGLKGYGEVCPLGPTYLPGFAGGVRAGLQELVPHILGADPLEVGKLNQLMDHHLKGHNYVKAGLDIACWDILGKHCDLPLYTLLGGHFGESLPVYKTIAQCSDEQAKSDVAAFSQQGYSIIQLKASCGNVSEDIRRIRMVREALPSTSVLFVDTNGDWLMHEALQVVEAVRNLDIYLEQPCKTYQECLSLKTRTALPIILDESVGDLGMLMRIVNDRCADVVKARDLFIQHGISVCIEESWGSDITTATLAHLAQSTPPRLLFSAVNFSSYVPLKVAHGAPEMVSGRMKASDKPGLGVTPIPEVLGEPVLTFRDMKLSRDD